MNFIYFDNSASTMLCDAAKTAIETEIENFANPSSLHKIGFEANVRLDNARRSIASTVFADKSEVFFTSSGSEANNMAIFGSFLAKRRRGNKIIITDSEHPSVREPVLFLQRQGMKVVTLSTKNGELDLDEVKKCADESVIFASIMNVNNETGAIYEVKKAFDIIKSASPNVITHSDCVQSYLKEEVSFKSLNADLISLSAHKIHGPKGVGALCIRKGVKIQPLMYGGGQEAGMRPSTETTMGIVAFASAANDFVLHQKEIKGNIKNIKEKLVRDLSKLDFVKLNIPKRAADNILSISVDFLKSEVLLHKLSDHGIFVSSGSACSSKKKDNPILYAFGLDKKTADSTLRLSFGRFNTPIEADVFINVLKEMVNS